MDFAILSSARYRTRCRIGGPVTVTLLWLWKIRLTVTGLPGRYPVIQESGWLGTIGTSTTLVETE